MNDEDCQKPDFHIVICFFIMFLIVALRVGYVQVVKGEIYIERAFRLWTRNIPVSNQRGKIFDRNGKLIVGNTLAPTVSIIPKQIKDKEYTLGKLASLLGVKKKISLIISRRTSRSRLSSPLGRTLIWKRRKGLLRPILRAFIFRATLSVTTLTGTRSHTFWVSSASITRE